MALLSERDREKVREAFRSRLVEPTTIVVFGQDESPLETPGYECEFCRETREFASELAALSDLVGLEVHDFVAERDLAERYGVDRIPAIVLLGPGGADPGIRFFGVPAGYEAATVVADLVALSRSEHGLSPATVEALGRLERDVHLKVFVTPT
jgi:thiol-disulfide isomerase/thioredoxin